MTWGTGALTAAFPFDGLRGQTMQFLVYLTILMVSISTVLLEIHWLTTPAPQPKPAIQASAPPPRPKIEGPNTELSPVYPRKVEQQATQAPQGNASADVANTANANPRTVEQPQPAPPTQQSNLSIANTPKTDAVQAPPVETTGASTRADDVSKSASASSSAGNVQDARTSSRDARQNHPAEATVSSNRCDVQACASYKSFRASDCTYQPFDGPRRACGKAPEQRANREQRDEPQRRSWSRREDSREAFPEQRADREQRDEPQRRSWRREDLREASPDVDRRTRWRVYDEDDDDDADDVIVYRRSRRW